MKRIKRILIANRGEIVSRIVRTCQEMGIQTVGVRAENEKTTSVCDETIALPGHGTAAYLDIRNVVAAAKKGKCDAVHPGYGFLSENPDFAKALEKSGIIFIGPSSKAMEKGGSKGLAKSLAKKLSIPTTDFIAEEKIDEKRFVKQLKELYFPLMIKPIAGGGGKGMKILQDSNDLEDKLSQARAEAVSAFGDGRLLGEVFVDKARHVEVQIAGARDGKVSHLYERDCTLQRRHQKVLEETPSPHLSGAIRTKIFEAALKLAQELKYENIGTVEFLVDSSENFYFMEINTRLQVEHPITEMVTGVDLVRAQILLAQGASLREAIGQPKQTGHAIEARIYAEDPMRHFLPATGKVLVCNFPSGDGVRIDAGVSEGTQIDSSFDPLLAKVIVHANTRENAFEKMARALSETYLLGVTTNLNLLSWFGHEPSVRKGEIDIGWLERNIHRYQVWEREQDLQTAISIAKNHKGRRNVQDDDDIWNSDPWLTLNRFRIGVQR